MITEINIYSDGTVISLNECKCLIPIASGTWAVLIDICEWANIENSRLPDECKFGTLRVFFVVRSAGKEERFPVPVSHLLNIGKVMLHIATCGYKPTEVIAKEIAEKIIQEYERE